MGNTVTLTPPGKGNKPPTRAEKPRKTALIASLSVAGGLLVVALAVLIWAMAGYGKIYSGVSVDGLSLGGFTVDEASAALEKKMSAAYEGASITLSVDGNITEITAEDAGAGFSARDTAENAYNMGRTGNVFSRALFVISSPFTERSLDAGGEFYIDRDALAARSEALCALVNKEPVQYTWDIGDSEILVRGGTEGRHVDPQALADLAAKRFLERNFSDIVTESDVVKPDPLPVETLHESIYIEPQNAFLDISNRDEPKIMPHTDGVSFDREEAARRAEEGGDFTIPLVTTPAEVDQAEFESNLFKDQLSGFSTNLSSSTSDRTSNIRLAASFINGTILLPGDTFSYNETVGERTAARGFKGAGAYVNGKLVDEIGGGICQMSSTLYNAALLANLKIVDRTNHSMTVTYVLAGRDATVNWGTIDFKFSNNTEYPIQILASVEGTKVVTKIMGLKETDFSVEIEIDKLSSNPYEQIVKVNESMAPGTSRVTTDGHHGSSVQTYRIVKDASGNVISRTAEAKSSYRRVDKVIEKGPDAQPVDNPGPADTSPSPPPSPVPSPSPAEASPAPSPEPPEPSPEPEPSASPASPSAGEAPEA